MAERPYSQPWFSRTFTKALNKAKIDKGDRFLDSYSLRHTFNTVLKPLLPLPVLMVLMGHKSAAVNEVYNHPTIETKMKMLQSYEGTIEAAFSVTG